MACSLYAQMFRTTSQFLYVAISDHVINVGDRHEIKVYKMCGMLKIDVVIIINHK